MQPIDLSRLIKDAPDTKTSTGSIDSQRMAIAMLLKQTVQNLAREGLLSIDTQKAIISAKNTLPGEFTQLYIQERLQQHKLAETLAAQTVKAAPLTQSTVNQWFSGQLIQAIVSQAPQNGLATFLVNAQGQFDPALLAQLTLSRTDSKASSKLSQALLQQSQQLTIKTDLPLQNGQQLLLEVIKTNSSFSFKLHSSPLQSQTISQYLNPLLARQQSFVNILGSLNEISQHNASAQKIFTPEFLAQVNKLVEQLPQFKQLTTPRDLRQALQNSGLFLENKLAQQTQNPLPLSLTINNDFKAGLMQLQNLILNNRAVILPGNLPGAGTTYNNIAQTQLLELQNQLHRFFEIPAKVEHAQVQKPLKTDMNLFLLNNPLVIQAHVLDKLEGALARIISTQIQTRETGEQAFFNFEIPFRHNNQNEVLQLKIREQFKRQEQEQGHKIWTVNLAFHLESLGGVRIYITLDELDIGIQVWTEEKHAQQLFQQNFYQLEERLLDAGFSISQLKAFHGVPDKARNESRDSPFIIDEQV